MKTVIHRGIFTIQKGKVTVEHTQFFSSMFPFDFFHPGNRFSSSKLHFQFQLSNKNQFLYLEISTKSGKYVIIYFPYLLKLSVCCLIVKCWFRLWLMKRSAFCLVWFCMFWWYCIQNCTVIMDDCGILSDVHHIWCDRHPFFSCVCVCEWASDCCVGKMHKMFQLVAHQKQSVGRISS